MCLPTLDFTPIYLPATVTTSKAGFTIITLPWLALLARALIVEQISLVIDDLNLAFIKSEACSCSRVRTCTDMMVT